MLGPFKLHFKEYDDLNLSVFPCGKKNGKVPLVKWGEYQYEMPDLSTKDLWLEIHPNANIGLVTGHLNGITVVDSDNPSISLEDLQKEFGNASIIVRTPSGGLHLYYKYNGESSKNGFEDKIDIKSDAGFVIAPYSVNPTNNNAYTIIKGSLDDIHSLTKSIQPSLPKRNFIFTDSSESQDRYVEGDKILEGKRNSTLFLVTKDHALNAETFDEISCFAKKYNQLHLCPALPPSEVNSVVQSVWRYKKSGRLFASGEQSITIDTKKLDILIKHPNALAIYLLLIKAHKGMRKEFCIIQHSLGEMLGCDRRTIAKCIKLLIQKNIIKRTHTSRGKNDGHKYSFL